jgi:hypothetical protein
VFSEGDPPGMPSTALHRPARAHKHALFADGFYIIHSGRVAVSCSHGARACSARAVHMLPQPVVDLTLRIAPLPADSRPDGRTGAAGRAEARRFLWRSRVA